MKYDPTVIAFDPGGVTGWALFQVHPDALLDPGVRILANIQHWSCGQFSGSESSQVDQMRALADDWPEAALVNEDFVPQEFNQSRAFLSPVRLNAAFSYIMRPRRVWYQMPSLAKTTITDDRLRLLGVYWHETEGFEHARVSVKHCLTFLKRLKEQPKLRSEVFSDLA